MGTKQEDKKVEEVKEEVKEVKTDFAKTDDGRKKTVAKAPKKTFAERTKVKTQIEQATKPEES